MKNLLFFSLVALFAFSSCQDAKNETINYDFNESSKLSAKDLLFRVSFELETISKNKFESELSETNPLNGTEEPIVAREKLTYEFYEDYSIGYSIEKQEPKTDGFKKRQYSADVPDADVIKVYDGMFYAYAKDGSLLHKEPYEEVYFEEAKLFENKSDLIEYFSQRIKNPATVKSQTYDFLKENSTEFIDINNSITKFIIPEEFNDENQRINDNYRVVKSESFFDKENGVLIAERGLNQSGELVDELVFAYNKKPDGTLELKAENYKTKIHSEAYDLDYTAETNYFYDNYKLETFN